MQIREVFDRKRFVFLDGGMGTQLQARGLQPGQKPELAALEMPEVLTAIHTDYANAGADILLANTFGANAKKLTGCGHTVEEVVSASIACARKAADTTGACVALDIGPLGELLVPAGTLAFEDAYNEFAQVIRAGAAAGADLVFLETMTDLYELKAAILAARENCDLPVFTSMSFESRGRTFTAPSKATPSRQRVSARTPWASTARSAPRRFCPSRSASAAACPRVFRSLSSRTPVCRTPTAATISTRMNLPPR